MEIDHPDGDHFSNLVKWLDKGKAYHNKLRLKYFSEEYRGVVAGSKIDEGEIVFFLPLK